MKTMELSEELSEVDKLARSAEAEVRAAKLRRADAELRSWQLKRDLAAIVDRWMMDNLTHKDAHESACLRAWEKLRGIL